MIEDVRTLLQDLVTPDLKAIKVRLDGIENEIGNLESTMDTRLTALEKRVDERFAAMDKRFDGVMAGITNLIRFNNIEARLAQLEADRKPPEEKRPTG